MFFNRVPASEIGTRYTHKGLFLGLVPCYIGTPDANGPDIAEWNGVPEPLFWLAIMAFEAFAFIAESLQPGCTGEGWPIKVTGKLEAA